MIVASSHLVCSMCLLEQEGEHSLRNRNDYISFVWRYDNKFWSHCMIARNIGNATFI